ncbi:hypothetical protein BIW11_08000 [Tropilaelaps mercedesae]|uniref:Uncharacterized protein n=1 Tax=Tropilaelaps mercedesae TaxID=418985 RepID=A0A1V9XRK5_9ACAR|nr:hypothetical protein BIW11_08000 [Tropilaelaps mercedesae]
MGISFFALPAGILGEWNKFEGGVWKIHYI